MNDSTAAAMLAALKLAGDHVAVVLDLLVLAGDGGEGVPNLGMGGNGPVGKGVDFVDGG